MDIITAEQAAEAAKGLTFEKVWAALMETRQRMEESQKRTDKLIAESQKRVEEAQKHTQTKIDELTKNIGGVNNSLGRFMESLFSEGLDSIFNELGYSFTKQGPHTKFKDKPRGRILAEADYFLEDGEYAMAVEVKMELKASDVNDHIERIAVIRRYFDERGDKRILVGAVAGGIVHDSVLRYAQRQGLYVITQKGESAVIAEMPEGFKAREW